MADTDGATPRELLIEACRRNNTSLLSELFTKKPPGVIAKFLNTTTDALGASALHIAAQYGNYEVLDMILDQEGVEIDGKEKRDGDTCLHKAVRYCSDQGWEQGKGVVDILVDAGCDPRYATTRAEQWQTLTLRRIRNKAKLRPVDLADPRNTELRRILQKAEMAMTAGDDVVNEDEDDDGGPGSESD